MSGILFPLLMVAGVALVVWKLLRQVPAFQIQLRQGTVQIVSGKLRPAFLNELSDVGAQAGLNQGTITGHQVGSRIVLKFSREFVPALQQQIRNIWYANS